MAGLQFKRRGMGDILQYRDAKTGNALGPMDAVDLSPQQLYIVQNFQSQVYIQDQMDVQDEPIFDTISYTVGTFVTSNTSMFFSNVIPQTSLKTLADTNMRTPNRLNSPEAQAIFGYRLKFNEDIDTRDFLAITKGFSYVFTMGLKDYQTGPIFLYQAGGGIYATNQGANAGTAGYLSNGFPAENATASLSVNLVIENEETFEANFQGIPSYTTLGALVRVQNLLMGLHARPIR